VADKFKESIFTNFGLVRSNRLAKEIVFVDGIGSSGKGMLSHLIASFNRVEKQSNHSVIDYVSYIHWMGKMSDDAATAYLQTEVDAQLYHLMMSRDVNFRPKDSTGVLQNPRKWEYFKRLFLKEGDEVVQRINTITPILNEAPHDAMRSAKLFMDTFPNELKIVYIMRDPLELILDWVRRGFGDRIGKDPREFQLSIQQNEETVPMFMVGVQEEYASLNDMERVVLMIRFCLQENVKGYGELNAQQSKSVFLLEFDELARDPFGKLNEIARFMGTTTSKFTKKAVSKEGLPRPVRKKEELLSQVLAGCNDKKFETYVGDSITAHDEFVQILNQQHPI
jgi:hypothetical protein